MKKAFTLVEMLIVVAIIGIMAAIVMPLISDHVQKAKESTAKDSLRAMRGAIGAYAAKNNDVPPGYADNDPTKDNNCGVFQQQMVGPELYFGEMPKNPLNGFGMIKHIDDSPNFPANPFAGLVGWVYQAESKTIRLNYYGTDSEGVRYFDY